MIYDLLKGLRDMKTVNEVIENTGIPARLVRGVIRQLGGMEEAQKAMPDICSYGADQGFSGFIYYGDTVEFFKKYRKEIIQHIDALAEEMGEDAATMMLGWPWLNAKDCNEAEKRELRESIRRCLGGGRLTNADNQTANALAWCALDMVARGFCV